MPDLPEVRSRIAGLLEQIELSTGQQPASEYRRASWRYTWAVPATVECVDRREPSEPVLVTTSGISVDGMSFRSRCRLKCDCKVMITLQVEEGPLEIPATVVHCTESLVGYLVGVAFDLD